MMLETTRCFDGITDDDLLALVRETSDVIDEKIEIFELAKKALEERGWQFVNWPEYVKAS